jgi:hypothetical protein
MKQTGYYVTKRGLRTKVHAAVDGAPICGARVGVGTFNWCANWWIMTMIECKTCKALAQAQEKHDGSE